MTLPRLLLILAIAAAVACSGGDDAAEQAKPDRGPTVGEPLPECPDADYSSCDIGLSECRTRLADLVACVRGEDDPVQVPFMIQNASEVAAGLSAAYAEEDHSFDAAFEAALVMLRLAEPGALTAAARIDETVESIAAFYDSEEKHIVIVDRGRSTDTAYASLILVHEYVHALQDAEFDLASLDEAYVDSHDSYLALRALIEGEAKYYETRVAAPMLGLDLAELDVTQTFEEQRRVLEEDAIADPSPIVASDFTFPYAFGPPLIHDAWMRGGTKAVRLLYSDPPTTTQELLARAWGGEPLGERFDDFEFPEVPATHEATDVASLGAWLIYLYLTSANAAPEAAREVALSARGDALAVYTDSNTGAVSLLWQLEFADPAQSEQFWRWEWSRAVDYDSGQQGTRVTVRASESTLPEWLVPPPSP